jgi:hypothetical protein
MWRFSRVHAHQLLEPSGRGDETATASLHPRSSERGESADSSASRVRLRVAAIRQSLQ